MIKELLVPLDGYEQSERVGRWAGRLAGIIGARVILLGIVDSSDSTFGDTHERMDGGDWSESDLDLSWAERYLKKLASEIRVDNDSTPEVLIRSGDAADEIARVATDYKVDAVVLATRRASALSRAVLGSVTDKVIKTISAPVIATNPESTMTLVTSPDVPAQIIVTLDGSELSESAVEHAIDLASQAGSSILFIRAITGAFASEQSDELRAERMRCMDYLDPFRQRAIDAGVKSECRVTSGSPARSIIDAAKSDPSSLIVMTTHGRSGIKRALLGSVADQVLRSSVVPVVVVPPPH